MLRLRTLGGLALLDETGAAVATQRRRVALLALLAVAGKHGLTRDKLVSYLWPESSGEHARHALEQILYALRRQVSDKLFLGSDPISLNPEVIESDIWQFEESLARGAEADAVAQYGGPFLDGFFLRGSDDFERWTESQRARVARDCRRALETLARGEAEQGNHQREVEWRRRIVLLDPLGTQGALDLIRAFAASGDRAGALQYARVYEALLRAELSSAPDPAITELVQRLQGEGATSTVELRRPTSATRPVAPSSDSTTAPTGFEATPPSTPWSRRVLTVVTLALVLAGATAAVLVRGRSTRPMPAKSVAVLPCTNLSSSRDDEFFSDGMTEELITTLGKIRDLRVPARTSAFAFKGSSANARQIGDELHVGSLVECTVRRGGGRFRITARLVDATDGYQLWSREYDRDVGDVFAVQDDISRSVAHVLQVTLAGADTLPARRLTTSQEVRDLYLHGRDFFGMRADEKSLRKSVEYFERAIQRDSSYAPAYSGLSDAYSVLSIWGFVPPRQGFPIAKQAALRALALDSSLAPAHTSLAIVSMWFDLDGDSARRELTRAIALDPNYPSAHLFYAWYLSNHGSADSAIAEARRARDLDPLSIIVNTRVGTMLYYAGAYKEALSELRTTLDLDSTNAMAHAELARVFVQLNQCSDALAQIPYLPKSFQNVERGVVGYVDAICGRRTEAVTMLKDLEDQSKTGFVFASRIALLHVALGEYDAALDWLERAIAQRDPMSQCLAVEPFYRPLRDDPRFRHLLEEAGLVEHRL